MSNETEKLEKCNEIQIAPMTPSDLLSILVQKGADLATLEKFLDLREREEKNQARKAFVVAMTKFKADPPEIYKDKENKQFKSKYSSIDAMVNSTIPKLSKYGLSHSWQIGETNGNPQVTCILTHELGHSESATMSAPPDTSGGGSKNPIQQIKSTQTYLKIATFEAVTGLVSTEANLDDDGNASGKISLLEQWEIKLDEAGTDAKSADEIATWWKTNSPTIKKELSKADAAKIYEKVKVYSKKLNVPERDPGSDSA